MCSLDGKLGCSGCGNCRKDSQDYQTNVSQNNYSAQGDNYSMSGGNYNAS